MKKKTVAILVLVLVAAASVFSLAACNEEEEPIDEFMQWEMWRYMQPYDYLRTAVYKYRSGGYDSFDLPDMQENMANLEYVLSYESNEESIYNNLYLTLQSALQKLGKTVTLSRDAVEFSGSLGKVPSELVSYQSIWDLGIQLHPDERVEEMMPFVEEELRAEYNIRPPYSSSGAIERVSVYFTCDEIECSGEIYRLVLVYSHKFM